MAPHSQNTHVKRLLILNKLRWYWRLPMKWTVLALTVLVVCFPYPSVLVRHVKHWSNPNALIEPDAASLQPLVEEFRLRLADDPLPGVALKRVERFVHEKIPYAWDWDTWGTADYLPTVEEAIEMGREDCDGRAVVAASLLANFGFKVQIVTDFSHVWVKTDKGETMGPRKNKTVVATKKGLKIQPSALREVPKALAYGIAVFPLTRELIVVAVCWLLMLGSAGRARFTLAGLACFLGGLFLLRAGGRNDRDPVEWMQWCGFVVGLIGFAILFIASHRARPVGAEKAM